VVVVKQNNTSFTFNNLHIYSHTEVYNPAEDTFLLLESIDVTKQDTVFEIGTGSGIIAFYCAQLGAKVLCSDINPHAIDLVKKSYEHNKEKIKGSLEIRKGNLFDVLNRHEHFSLIIFNPPYLPTSENEIIGGSGWFDKAVSGGKTGLDITNKFLAKLKNHLIDNGRAFIIFSTNSPREVFNKTVEKNDLQSTILATQSYMNETIEVHKLTKKKKN
jgi:release factor glutamine methyltransferase